MSRRTIAFVAVVAVALLVAGTSALAREGARRRAQGWKALGLRAYWSLLSEEQQEQAKTLLIDHLAQTAPDRLSAAARLMRFKADVVTVLTPEQRVVAGRIHWLSKHRTREERLAAFDQLLEGTDRDALAALVERHVAAAPDAKVAIAFEILDRIWAVLEPKAVEVLGLGDAQQDRIRALYEDLKTDLEPVALRLETAKAEAVRAALAILDDDQRETLERFRTHILEKVLTFLRG